MDRSYKTVNKRCSEVSALRVFKAKTTWSVPAWIFAGGMTGGLLGFQFLHQIGDALLALSGNRQIGECPLCAISRPLIRWNAGSGPATHGPPGALAGTCARLLTPPSG